MDEKSTLAMTIVQPELKIKLCILFLPVTLIRFKHPVGTIIFRGSIQDKSQQIDWDRAELYSIMPNSGGPRKRSQGGEDKKKYNSRSFGLKKT